MDCEGTLTNLPTPLTPLIGRERETEEVLGLLARHRLITLVGAGGCGKTRLALELGARAAATFRDGARWVPLQDVGDPALVLPAVAGAVGARGRLENHLADRAMLIVLDNFEHVVAAAHAVADLLAAAPALTVLATSRQPLHISLEHEYPVPPLDVPEGVRLFVERARAVKNDFEPSESVPSIARRLDGLPLAIELAAARVNVLSAAGILEHLDRRLALLTGGPRDLPDRQRTLRATIQWSADLLSPSERQLFSNLAVFAGTFDLDAAEEVCGADLDAVGNLVDKSLVQADGERFRMLETIRDYALEELSTSGDDRRLRSRHALYYCELGREFDASIRGVASYTPLERLGPDHDNVRAALDWLLREEPNRALQLALDVEIFWTLHGRVDEGAHWFAQVLEATAADVSSQRAHAFREAASFAGMRGRADEARRLAERALEEAVQCRDEREIAGSLLALERYDEALAVYEAVEDRRGVAVVRGALGMRALAAGAGAEAVELVEDALSIWRELDRPWGIAGTLVDLGDCLCATGRTEEAVARYEESLALARRLNSEPLLAEGIAALATAVVALGDVTRAAELRGAADSAEERYGFRVSGRSRDDARLVAAVREAPDAYERGRRLSLADALAELAPSVD